MKHHFPEGYFHYHDSPMGKILMAASDRGVCYLNFIDDAITVESDSYRSIESLHPFLQKLITELDSYFAGNTKLFSVPLDLQGTDFQKKVWEAVAAIPYGESVSYAKLSGALGNPDAIRAVANANARNPVLIIVPCHRVIGTDGSLTGYAAGLHRKKFLLELEGILQPSHQLNLNFN